MNTDNHRTYDMTDAHAKTLEWQKSQYVLDSGINSGMQTQTPSVYKERLDVDRNETITEESAPMMPKMHGPAHDLKSAVVNLINYQDDADIARSAIPQLSNLLNDTDPVIICEAMAMIYRLSKQQASRHAILNYIPMIQKIIDIMSMSDDFDIVRFCVATIHNISCHMNGLSAIMKCGGVSVLVKLLSSTVDEILFYSITCIHNILQNQDESKSIIRAVGGLPKMVGLLIYDNVKFLTITADCLRMLCYGHNESKLDMLESGGANQLVRIMQTYSYEKLLYTVARMLKVLSVDQTCKNAIVENGGMQVVASILPTGSKRLVHNCLWTMRNLSDSASVLCNIDDMVIFLVKLLQSDEPTIVTCATGILSNLSCNNPHNKSLIVCNGGIEMFVKIIGRDTDKEDIVEPAICALRHLTARHEYAELAKRSVRQTGGFNHVVRLLGPPSSISLISAVIGLIRNLALSNENTVALREQGCIPRLVQLLYRINMDIKGEQGPVENMNNLANTAEAGCAALHILAKDPNNRSLIISLNCVPVFLELICNGQENLQRASTGVMSEIAIDRVGAKQIIREEATYAAGVLVRIQKEDINDFERNQNTASREEEQWFNTDL